MFHCIDMHKVATIEKCYMQAGVKHVMLTLGSQGAAVCSLGTAGMSVMTQHLPAIPANIVNTNGAGDCLVAGALACLVQKQPPINALAFGMVSSTCMCSLAPDISLVAKAC